MRHHTPSFLLLLITLASTVSGQQVQWLTTRPIAYDINPDSPTHLVCASDADHAYVARSTTLTYLYGTVYGSAEIEQRNASGQTVWAVSLGDSVLLQAMASDASGRVIIGGRFFRSLHIGALSDLPVVNGNEFPETFLIALDIDGNLLWQRNITPNDPQGTEVQSITFDAQGRAWYATCDFFNAEIQRLDDAGNDVETRPILDAKTIGNISFDPQGGLYVSGSASTPGITVNGTVYPITTPYNFFVARMGVDGTSQWLRSAEDVTFQRPRVAADAFGHACLLGSPFDSLTFGGIHFHGPEWNSTFFLVRLDSMGNFQWGFQPPVGSPFTGQFGVGQKDVLGVDGNGNATLLGIANGVIAWGNNVVTDVGSIQERAVTLLQLDSTGTPQWELHGGSEDYDVPEGLSVLPDGICHIAVQVRDTFHLGALTADVSSATLLVARIASSSSTGVEGTTKKEQDITAYPSPFTNTFALSGEHMGTGAVDVWLRDASGRVVAFEHRTEGLGSALAPGAYLVAVQQGETRWHGRVVKE